jgi:glyoxylase-like metal-dependent hydrolase (beta-lactamase superfamily II)
MLRTGVGHAKLVLLDDGSFPFPAAEFFSNVPEHAWRRELATDAQGKIMVGHNCALVESGREAILVDTGYGDDTHGGRTGRLLDELALAGWRREHITMVVNTHAHGDHTSRNTLPIDGGRVPAFPNARYFLGRADWERFGGAQGQVHHFDANLRSVHDAGLLTLVDGTLQLTPEVTLVPTPGHSPGHMSVFIESGGRTAICLGDVCHHPLHFAHPGWVSSFDTDPAGTKRTRAWLFALALARDALLACPHAAAPGLGRLRLEQDHAVWMPADA